MKNSFGPTTVRLLGREFAVPGAISRRRTAEEAVVIHSSMPWASSRAVNTTCPRNGVSSRGLELPDVSISRTSVAAPTAAGLTAADAASRAVPDSAVAVGGRVAVAQAASTRVVADAAPLPRAAAGAATASATPTMTTTTPARRRFTHVAIRENPMPGPSMLLPLVRRPGRAGLSRPRDPATNRGSLGVGSAWCPVARRGPSASQRPSWRVPGMGCSSHSLRLQSTSSGHWTPL